MGTEDENDSLRLQLSETLTYSYDILIDQRKENARKIEKMFNFSSAKNFNHLDQIKSFFVMDEQKILGIAREILSDTRIWHYFLAHVDDVPPVYSLSLVANIKDISEIHTATDLWTFCGMHSYKVDTVSKKRWFRDKRAAVEFVVSVIRFNHLFKHAEGTLAFDKEIKDILSDCVWGSGFDCKNINAKTSPNRLVNWSLFLRNLCWRIGESIKIGHGFYHGLYAKYVKEKIEASFQISDMDIKIIEDHASRHITKLFLIHVVQYWRQLEGHFTKEPKGGKEACIEFPNLKIVYSESLKG